MCVVIFFMHFCAIYAQIPSNRVSFADIQEGVADESRISVFDRGNKLVFDASGKPQVCCAGTVDGTPVRIEFTNLPKGFVPLPGESRVQFATTPVELSIKRLDICKIRSFGF